MGPDLELKGRSEMVTEASGNKETAGIMKEPEDKHMRCASNYEDNNFEMEALVDDQIEGERSQDVEVNILEHTNSFDLGLVEAEFQDQTENSSSFEDTGSGFENGTTLSDADVDSGLLGDGSSTLSVDGYSDFFRVRKKKLTPHWRTYIQPLVWRCKWVELQIKKFQSQASEYDKELAKYNQRKKAELESCMLEGIGSKSHAFSGRIQRKEVMKRKKRKRVEDTGDMMGYMSRHKLFSYFESKRSAADAPFMDEVLGNQVKIDGNSEGEVNDEPLSLEFNDTSVEQILCKIGIVHLQVANMKTRLHKIMSENSGKFSSTDKLSLLAPCNALTSSAGNPASPHDTEDKMMVGSSSYMPNQLIQDYSMGDLVMPESAASSHGEVTHVSDIVESTEQPEVGGSSKNVGGGMLIYSRRPKEELKNSFKGVDIQIVGKKPQVPKEEQEDTSIPAFDSTGPDVHTEDQPAPKIRSISKLTATKNTRKRGRRKAGLGRWSRRSSG